MVDESCPVPSITKLGKLANSRKFANLEAAWLPAVVSGEYSGAELLPIAGQVGRLGEQEKAVTMAMTLLTHIEENHGLEAALSAAQHAAREIPASREMREEILRLYRSVYQDYPGLDELLKFLADDEDDLDVLVATVEAYLPLRTAAYVRDPNYTVPGVVEEVDVRNGVITVRFDKRRQEYGRANLGKITVLPEDHFPSLVLYDSEQLCDLAEEDPIAFILLALKASQDRRLSYRDLKQAVTRLLGEKGWQQWWRGTRLALKRAPRIETSGGSQPSLRLLNQARNYEERLRKEFDSKKNPLTQLTMVLSYLDETRGNVVAGDQHAETAFTANEELLVHFGNSAAKLAVASLGDRPTVSLAGLATHAEVATREVPIARPNPNAAVKVLDRITSPAQLAVDLPEPLLLRTLDYLRTVLPDRWPQIWARVMTRASRRVCDLIARALVQADQSALLEDVLKEVVEQPTSSPEATCWIWRARQSASLGKILVGFTSLPAADVLTSLLNLTDASGKLVVVSDKEHHKRYLDMAQRTLAQGEGQPVRDIFVASDKAEAARFKNMVEQNNGLTASGRGKLLSLLRIEHGELFEMDASPWSEDLIYTTNLGLKMRQSELATILEEDMPAVAKQIGEAAAFGDLSENAEYTAALEKRDQLTSRAKNMEQELLIAQLITPEMAQSKFVNIGTRITAKNLTSGEQETYTFLGPWDADADQHILTYNAPLALAFMGKKVGEEVTYGEDAEQKSWEVLTVEAAI